MNKPGRIAKAVAITAAAAGMAMPSASTAQEGPTPPENSDPVPTQPGGPGTTPPEQSTPAPEQPQIIPDARAPWLHAADRVGEENATPYIMALVEKAKRNGWQVVGNDQSGGKGAFVSVTTPEGVTHTDQDEDFNTTVNGMLDTVEQIVEKPDPPKNPPGNPPQPPRQPSDNQPIPPGYEPGPEGSNAPNTPVPPHQPPEPNVEPPLYNDPPREITPEPPTPPPTRIAH